jgi:hypothetical protein
MAIRRIVVACVVAAGLVVPGGIAAASAAPGSSHWPDLQCGLVTQNVRLREDLTCPGGVVVDSTTSTTITIDLGGHTLTGGNGSCFDPGCFAISALDSATLTVRDGTVAGAVAFYPKTAVIGATGGGLAGVHVEDGVFIAGESQRIQRSQIDGPVTINGSDTALVDNMLHGGVTISDSLFNPGLLDIERNTIVDAPATGIQVVNFFSEPDVGGTIADNVIRSSGGPGMDLGDGTDLAHLMVTGNRLLRNAGDGVSMELGSDTVGGTGSVTFTDNVARSNGGHGFDLTPADGVAVTDGGGNVASVNAASPQCIGISC